MVQQKASEFFGRFLRNMLADFSYEATANVVG